MIIHHFLCIRCLPPFSPIYASLVHFTISILISDLHNQWPLGIPDEDPHQINLNCLVSLYHKETPPKLKATRIYRTNSSRLLTNATQNVISQTVFFLPFTNSPPFMSSPLTVVISLSVLTKANDKIRYLLNDKKKTIY